MAPRPDLLKAYRVLEKLPLGGSIFSRLYRLSAPYFVTIPASITGLEPGLATARMPQVWWVRNHLGGVHAIALCNLAEYAMGAVAEATIPPTHRWVPKAMSVEYRAKARGTMSARAVLRLPELRQDAQELDVSIEVTDADEIVVFVATITIWVTPRPHQPA